MKKLGWEYHWVRLPLYESGGALNYDVDTLDELGRDGWEAYAVTQADALEERQLMLHLRRPRTVLRAADKQGRDA